MFESGMMIYGGITCQSLWGLTESISAYQSYQCYRMYVKIHAEWFTCEIQIVCDNLLPGDRSYIQYVFFSINFGEDFITYTSASTLSVT